jgi:hypothetical protein
VRDAQEEGGQADRSTAQPCSACHTGCQPGGGRSGGGVGHEAGARSFCRLEPVRQLCAGARRLRELPVLGQVLDPERQLVPHDLLRRHREPEGQLLQLALVLGVLHPAVELHQVLHVRAQQLRLLPDVGAALLGLGSLRPHLPPGVLVLA